MTKYVVHMSCLSECFELAVCLPLWYAAQAQKAAYSDPSRRSPNVGLPVNFVATCFPAVAQQQQQQQVQVCIKVDEADNATTGAHKMESLIWACLPYVEHADSACRKMVLCFLKMKNSVLSLCLRSRCSCRPAKCGNRQVLIPRCDVLQAVRGPCNSAQLRWPHSDRHVSCARQHTAHTAPAVTSCCSSSTACSRGSSSSSGGRPICLGGAPGGWLASCLCNHKVQHFCVNISYMFGAGDCYISEHGSLASAEAGFSPVGSIVLYCIVYMFYIRLIWSRSIYIFIFILYFILSLCRCNLLAY
jgi:hypothetical protein